MDDRMACLKALTPESRAAMGADLLEIVRFPFRVGRESRTDSGGRGHAEVRRRADSTPNNDLYLPETGSELNVSREHFMIDLREGGFVLVDRGSSCGTLVEGIPVGNRRGEVVHPLADQDVVVVGTSTSRYVFKFVVGARG